MPTQTLVQLLILFEPVSINSRLPCMKLTYIIFSMIISVPFVANANFNKHTDSYISVVISQISFLI